MNEELKPCPFCGWEAEETNNEGFPAMRCSNPDCFAGVELVSHIKRESLREYWNTRAERTCRKVPGRMKYGRRMPACSECGYSLGDDRWFFCPKCGAKVVD